MRIKTTTLLAICGVAVGVLLAPRVMAGNVNTSSAKYFDAELLPGQSLSVTNSRIILVDDITYAAEFEPCIWSDACKVFSEDMFPDWAFDVPPASPGIQFWAPAGAGPGSPSPPPQNGQGPFWSGGASGFVTAATLPSYMHARSAHMHLIVNDTGINGTKTIDRYSVSSYFQMGFHGAGSSWAQFRNTSSLDSLLDPLDPAYPEFRISGAGAGGSAAMSDMPAYGIATPTSASRHYQSPHFVYYGSVSFTATGTSTAYAIIKGRTLEGIDVPAQETAITIQ